MIPHVVDQLLRFRFHKYFCQFDVKSMYFSVQLKEMKDSMLFQFLYKSVNDDQAQLLVYCFRYVVMGSRDASFQTASCIAKIADIVQEELPEVSKTLREIYVDDGNTFSDTAAKCNKTLKDTIKVLEEYNFRVHKIISDNQEVLKDIPIEKLSKDTKFVKHSKEFAQTSQKETLAIKTSKCLGVHFQIDHDENKSFISYSH